MVASRFENSLFSRPWMAQTGVYPGQPAATPQQAATPASAQPNAPLQIMAGSLPAAQPAFQPQGQGEGYGGGGMDPNATGYGVSPSLGAFATSVLSNLGPFGMAATLATMMADPKRGTPYGILSDIFGWGMQNDVKGPETFGPTAPDSSFAFGSGMKGDVGFDGTKSDFSGFGGDIGGPTTAGSPETDPGAPGGPDNTGVGDGTHGDGVGLARFGAYTGAGADGVVQPNMPVPIQVHEGEQVLRHEAVQKYGRNSMSALNEGKVPKNKLVALAKRYR